jgi:hypothetical protein
MLSHRLKDPNISIAPFILAIWNVPTCDKWIAFILQIKKLAHFGHNIGAESMLNLAHLRRWSENALIFGTFQHDLKCSINAFCNVTK